jgi:type I restriction enzyme S subunit
MSGDVWREYQVAEIAAPRRWALNGGPFGSKLVSSMYVPSGVPVIRGGNLPSDRRFDEADFVFVSEEKAVELRQHEAMRGDLIITQRGTLGQVGLIPNDSTYPRYIVSQSQMKLTVDGAKADSLFVYYAFRSPDTTRRIQDLALTAGVPHINLAILRSFSIRLPSLPTQRRIASILGAYDDLIEVNRRRIALLEEMARRLFEEWFVHFRFPGHEGVRMAETPEGPLPEGWRRVRLGQLAKDVRDGVSPADVPAETPYVGLEHLPRRSTTLDAWAKANEVISTKLRFRRGDVLFGKIRPYFHKVAWAPFDGVSSSDAIVFRALSSTVAGLALAVAASDRFVAHAVQTSNGTKMPRASASVLAQYPVAMPPAPLLDRFNRVVLDNAAAGAALHATNARLAASRDLLLPRLISGDLPVAAAERELETAA